MQGDRSSFEGIWTNDDDTLAHINLLMKGRPRLLLFQPPFDSHGGAHPRSEQCHLALRMLRGPRHFTRDGYLLLDALMRSCLVEVDHIGIGHALELLLLKDQQVVEAFLPHTPHEAFADRIGAWRMRGRVENLDATCPRHPSKARPEFAIVITNQVLRCLAKGGGFSQVLGHPGISRRSCHADMDHSSCLERGC